MSIVQDYLVEEIQKERQRQDEKWGEQNHHPLMWFSIMAEEFGKMCQAFNQYTVDDDYSYFDNMQREAIQLAAVAIAMIECIDRMGKKGMVAEGKENRKTHPI